MIMKLCECKHGVLVKYSGIYNEFEIGMVVGITNNCGAGDLPTRSDPDPIELFP